MDVSQLEWAFAVVPAWVPWALMAASVGANYYGQRKVDKNQQQAYDNFQREQDKLEKRGMDAAASSAALYENQPQVQEEAGEVLGSAFKDAQQHSADAPVRQAVDNVNAEGGGEVVGYGAKRRQGAKRYSQELADALGQMRGVDQGMLGASLGARDNASDIRQLNSFMRGEQGLLDARLLDASKKGQAWGTAGDMLSLAAMVASPAALAAPANVGGAASVTGASSVAPSASQVALGATPGLTQSSIVAPAGQALTASNGLPWWTKAMNTAKHYGRF